MKLLEYSFALIALCIFNPSECIAESSLPTHAAARAMAKTAVDGIKFQAGKNADLDASSKSCYKNLQASILDEAFSKRAEDGLNPSDIEKVDAFYASTLGKRFLTSSISHKTGTPINPNDFTKEEQRAIVAFTQTPEAKKLFELFLPNDPELQQLVRKLVKSAIHNCIEASP